MCNELIESIKVLKTLLDDNGEYSIARTDKQPMDLPSVVRVVSVLERIDKALLSNQSSGQKITGECLFAGCADAYCTIDNPCQYRYCR